MAHPARRTWLVVLACTVLTACGSTVQYSSSTDDGTAVNGDGLTPVTAPGASGAPVVSGTTTGGVAPGTVSAGTSGAPASTTSSTGTGAVPVAAPSGPVPAKGPGWDEKTVYIGVITQKDTQTVYASFGANNVDPGDNQAQAVAMANELNKRGGILGRTVKLRFHDLATLATAQNPSVAGQAVCTHFSQDEKVIAVWNSNTQIDQDPTLRTCLKAHQVPLFTTAARGFDDRMMSELSPYYYHALMVSWDALSPVFVARLKAQGWMSGWNAKLGRAGTGSPKIGVLVERTPQGGRLGKRLTSDLARAGYPGALTFTYAKASDGQAASVQFFNGNGVTHVIVTDVELTAFQGSAASQNYKPRYGITTYNDPWGNLEASGVTPPGANNGAIGVGWAPNMDVSDANDPGTAPGAAACRAIMKRGGQTFSGKRLAAAWAFTLCDSFTLIASGAVAGGGFSAPALRAGIVKLRAGFKPANGFRPGLWSDGPYVAGAVRDLQWHPECSCMRYGTAVTPLRS